MPPAPPSAQTILCPRCGGVVALSGLEPRLRCPYCQSDVVVPRETLASLAAYQRSVGALVGRIEGQQQARAQWERWYGPDGKAKGSWVLSLVIIAPMLLLTFGGALLASAKVIDEQTLGRILPAGILGLYFFGFGGYVLLRIGRGKRAGKAHVAVGAECPRCGAPQSFDAGTATERCAHCGASLVAGPTLMAHAAEVASSQLRLAAMARYRTERTAMATIYRSSAAGATPYIILGSFLPITLGGSVAFTVDMLSNAKSDTPLAGLAVLWLIGLVNLGLLLGVYYYRAARRKAWRAVADATASRLAGRVPLERGEWVAWLNAIWAGPYPVVNLMQGPCFHAVLGQLGPFPVALDLDPVPADSRSQTARGDVLLAAWLPGDAESLPVPPDLAAQGQALGFYLSSCCGGFVGQGGLTLKQLRKCPPSQAADWLTQVAGLLAKWAERAGAVPARVIP